MKTIFKAIFILILISKTYGQINPENLEFQVNTYTTGYQFRPAIAALKNAGFVACWQSVGQDGDEGGIYAQLFDATGIKTGNEFRVNANTINSQENPSVTGLQDGGFVVCWEDWGTVNDYFDSFGQMFDALGNKQGSEFQINSYSRNYQGNPNAVALKNGGFVIVWESWGQDGSESGIYGQLFDSFGARKENEFRVNTYTSGSQYNSSVAELQDGGFVVCWECSDSVRYGFFGQIFDNNADKKGEEFCITSDTGSFSMKPSVAGLTNGGFVICWYCDNWFWNSWIDLLIKIYDNLGRKIKDEFRLNLNSTNYPIPENPSIAGLLNGGFILCWQSRYSDDFWVDVLGQIFDTSGNKKGSEFQIATNRSYWQEDATVVGLQDSGFVVCWESGQQDGSDWGVFGRYFPKENTYSLQNFAILEPLNDATLNTTHPNFRWRQPSKIRECYPWELTFDLYIDTDFNFPHPQIIKNIEDTTCTIDSLVAGKTYFWKVLAKNLAGDSLWSTQQDWGFYICPTATSVETADENVPQKFELFQNYPNPFNSSTEIKYSLPQDKSSYQVTLKIYDIRGRLVNTLVDKNQAAGTYSVSWDGKDINKNDVSSDIYFYSLEANEFKTTKKLLLIH
jgi:hypothetical protein